MKPSLRILAVGVLVLISALQTFGQDRAPQAASQDEVNAGLVNTKAVTPAGLAGWQPKWNPYSQGQFDRAPRGVSMWFGGIGTASETNLWAVVTNMVGNGMVANGYDTILIDGGCPNGWDSPFPFVTNGVPYPALTNATGWLDFDTNYFPHGAAWTISMMHSNGIKCILYAFNAGYGNANGSTGAGTNVYANAQPGLFGSAYYYNWLSNAVVNWKLDGIKDEISGNNYTNGIVQQAIIAKATTRTQRPFFVNVSGSTNGYQPYYRGLFNSWRIGVGIAGDVYSVGTYYTWLDNTPFYVADKTAFNDLDEYVAGDWFQYNWSLIRNRLAMDSMANAAILVESVPAVEKNNPLVHATYYENYDNPVINSVQADFTSRVQLVSSNSAGVVTYQKLLKDGTYAVCLQNRNSSVTNTATIGLTNLYPTLFPPVATIHDCFLNAPIAVVTNTYTATIATNDVAWFKVIPGVEQPFPNGASNYLANFPWSAGYAPGQSLAIGVNNFGGAYFGSFGKLPAPFRGNSAYPTNQSCLQFDVNVTNNFSWIINGNATALTFGLIGWIGNTDCKFYGDGTLLADYNCVTAGYTNYTVNLTGVNKLTLVMTNASESYCYFGDPIVYCPYTKLQPGAFTATNAPANGNALRYTNGVFYWGN